MGKRKRRTDWNKTPPSHAFMSHSRMESSLKEKSSHSFGCTGARPTSSSPTNIMEMEIATSANHQSSIHHSHHNVNCAVLSRDPRHYYSIKHLQKITSNHAATSTSHGKTTLRDEKHTWKLGHIPESGFRYYAGRRDKTSRRLKRIRSNPLVINSSEVDNMVCRLCQLRTREGAVVAVLVCGHAYHADCLEVRTTNEDSRDPPCPLCMH